MSQAENIPVEFVDLLNHPDDEILNAYPFTIRKKANHYELKETTNSDGYLTVTVDGKHCRKHRLIAMQFLPNPGNLPFIDHIDRDRTNNHLDNLRWVTASDNSFNRKSHKNMIARYIDEISPEALVVDYYDTRTERHYFDDYYYYEGTFYHDIDINYKILNINTAKNGTRYVYMKSREGNLIAVVITRFLAQHDIE